MNQNSKFQNKKTHNEFGFHHTLIGDREWI
jgi:hypothetical protein